VILLDHRVIDQVSTRRLRIVKYRGTTHGTNEYPFLIDERGIDVLPVTSLGLEHRASSDRVSTGVKDLDEMLGGGVYRGSTVLISGTAGAGKSSLSAHFARAAAQAGERCLYFAFEESPSQIMRNMRSIGVNLEPAVKKGLVRFVASRPVLHGLESHLAVIHKQVRDFKPQVLVLDPISDLTAVGSVRDAKAMMTRLVDYLKTEGITAVLTNLNHGGAAEATEIGISSLVDTWLLLRDIESAGERNRGMYILKSRGMAHSNQIREFILSERGIELREAYVGPGMVLTGSARLSQESRDQAEQESRKQEDSRTRRELERTQKSLAAQIAALQAEFDRTTEESLAIASQESDNERRTIRHRHAMEASRRSTALRGSAKASNVSRAVAGKKRKK